jgi:ABC-type glycerol-3-phosphate transport system permease component
VRRGWARSVSGRWRRAAAQAGTYAVLLGLMTWIVFPFLWALSTSLRPIDTLFTLTPEWLPHPVTLENYRWALGEPTFMIPLRNSFLVSTGTAAVSVALASVAAYSLARFRYRGKNAVVAMMLGTQMLPTMLLIIPIFLIYARVDLYDTFAGLILASTAWTLPYAVLLLRSFFLDVPVSLEEQALVDGCGRLGAFCRVTLPLSLAGLVAVLVFVFIWTWGDMLFPLILAKNIDRQTAALSLFTMMQSTRGATNYSGLLAAGVLFTLPAVTLFVLLQRPLLEGLRSGALKE